MIKIEKTRVPVIIYTATHKIEGTYFMQQGSRLTDDLNGQQSQFIPLKDVRVTDLKSEGDLQFRCDFMAISVRGIVLFCPKPKAETARARNVISVVV